MSGDGLGNDAQEGGWDPDGIQLASKKRGGRKAGVPNKLTKALKEMILGALSDAGGQDYLTAMAHAQPQAFMSLLGRVLPTTLTGADGGPLVVKVVRFSDK